MFSAAAAQKRIIDLLQFRMVVVYFHLGHSKTSKMEGQKTRDKVLTLAVVSAVACSFSLFSVSNALLVQSDSRQIHSFNTNPWKHSSSMPCRSASFFFPSPIQSKFRNPRTESQIISFYVDEWADADVELAFSSNRYSTPSPMVSPEVTPFVKRKILYLVRLLLNVKEFLRSRIERCTVYVLELEDGKYYVGSTTNRKRRIQQHISRRGSKWTKEHKPIGVLREYRRIPSRYVLGMESRITAECMLKFGVNNVRGSMFCSPRDYHMGDIDALTKFLGHYNDLSYRKVNLRLSQTLPATQKRTKSSFNNGKCFCCRKYGHFAADCPDRDKILECSSKY